MRVEGMKRAVRSAAPDGVGRGVLGAAIAAAVALGAAAPVSGQATTYLDFDDLTRELRSVVDASDLASMRSLGSSRAGREIWMVTLAQGSTPTTDIRPGVLLVGNLSGDHLAGSQLALEAVRYLTGAGASEADLANHVIYIVPRLNPDGAEAMFAGPEWGRRGNAFAFDDDNDGRMGEDGPDDLNGDGVVTVMRVPDPAGSLMVDPDDARIMRRADAAKGERGTHRVMWEGRDSDGDGFVNEDGPGGVDLDRNFQHEYPYWAADAGANMVSEPETRSLMDFVVAHKNIAAILTFGHSDNLVSAPNGQGRLADPSTVSLQGFADESFDDLFTGGILPTPRQAGAPRLRGAQPGSDNDPSSGRRPETTVNRADREYFSAVAEAYEELTGISDVVVTREPEGAFFQYGYFQFGVPSFSTPGWGMPGGDEVESEGDARLIDGFAAEGINAFVDWTPFQHPELGAVEIGGFRPYELVNPPASMLADLGARHGAFVARVSSMLPRVRLADVAVEAHGGGVFTVTADVVNEGYFPSSMQHGVTSRSVDPVLVQIQVEPGAIVTGANKSHRIAKLDGSGTRERVTWVIRGANGDSVEVRVRSEKGGTDTRSVRLGGDR